MTRNDVIRLAFEECMSRGHAALVAGDTELAMTAFEEAHILGQDRTVLHVRSHLAMLRWAWRKRERRETAGQVPRIVAAALFTWLWVPLGNPGSTRMGALKSAPIPEHLARILKSS